MGCMKIMGNCRRITLWDVVIVWDGCFLSSFHQHIIPQVQAGPTAMKSRILANHSFSVKEPRETQLGFEKRGWFWIISFFEIENCHTQSPCESNLSKMLIFLKINTAKSIAGSIRFWQLFKVYWVNWMKMQGLNSNLPDPYSQDWFLASV